MHVKFPFEHDKNQNERGFSRAGGVDFVVLFRFGCRLNTKTRELCNFPAKAEMNALRNDK